jgi:predicted DsbA family dithiol-disulfide isomerase
VEEISTNATVVYVDPSCPFAWITSRWLAEVEAQSGIDLQIRLLSLSVVNEHREIDGWYRGFNDHAWGPARVMAAVAAAHGTDAARRFYEAFGKRFHVELDTGDDADRDAVAAEALADAGLPASSIDAATDERWDDELRSLTRAALVAVGLDVGVPITVIDGVATSGPVLSEIPRGDAALALFNATRTLARHPGFVRIERQRIGALHVA